MISSGFTLFLIWKFNFKKDSIELKKLVLYPALGIHLFFLVGYYFSLIPPVPVAVKKIGIYYQVEKHDGHYIGKHLKPFWKIWENGSEEYFARPGDKVTVLLAIFSPARFQDQVFLKWYRDDEEKGLVLEDTIPLSILGGRDEGFRGYGSKQYYSLGDWRVIVETSDGREVGRINFTIKADSSTNARVFKDDIF